MSIFGDDVFGGAAEVLTDLHGDDITYQAIDLGTLAGSATFKSIFNELVGALDEFGNAVFHFRQSDLDPAISHRTPTVPERNDRITIGTDVWTVVDVRTGKDDTWELRAIIPQERS